MNENQETQISIGKRLSAMLLNHICMSLIAMVFFIPEMKPVMLNSHVQANHTVRPDFMDGAWVYFGLLGFALYFMKDCINGRSISKRILKLQVVDHETGQAASPLKCLIRNLYIVVWPIELLFTLKNTSRRYGDKVAGTQVVEFSSATEQPKLHVVQILISFALIYSLLVALKLAL